MADEQDEGYLNIKIVQGGAIKKIDLSDENLETPFKKLYLKLLKTLSMKSKDVCISNNSGKMISVLDLKLSLKEIVEKFGDWLNLYYDKII